MLNNFLRKSRRLRKMWKNYGRAKQDTYDDIMRCMLCLACWITKATQHTLKSNMHTTSQQ
jgi:hypothetical protein